VVVTDDKGAPLADLPKEGFHLEENGKGQTIAVFREVKTAPLPAVASQSSGFGNFSLPDASERRLTILVFDLNLPIDEIERLNMQVSKFLEDAKSKGESVVVLSVDIDGMHIIHDPYRGSVQQIQPTDLTGTNATVAAGNRSSAHTDVRFRMPSLPDEIQSTFHSLGEVAQAFAGIPGRKTLLWITGGFPFEINPSSGMLESFSVVPKGTESGESGIEAFSGGNRSLSGNDKVDLLTTDQIKQLLPTYLRTVDALHQSDVAVYPVEVAGRNNSQFLQVLQTQAAAVLRPGNQLGDLGTSWRRQSLDTMKQLAQMTGGNVIADASLSAATFINVAQESSDYYVLGFKPDVKNAKPGWHRINVKISVHGARVLSTSGFFANSVPPQTFRQFDVLDAVKSRLDYTGIPITVNWAKAVSEGDKRKVGFEVLLAPNSGVIDERNGNKLSLEIVAVATDKDGKSAGQFSQAVSGSLKPENMTQVKRDGISYANQLVVPAGEYSVRFVVRDNLTGRIGAISVPLKVS
jgi:VWFA-related protein